MKCRILFLSNDNCASIETYRFEADNWNKLKNMASKAIGEKMKKKEPVRSFWSEQNLYELC